MQRTLRQGRVGSAVSVIQVPDLQVKNQAPAAEHAASGWQGWPRSPGGSSILQLPSWDADNPRPRQKAPWERKAGRPPSPWAPWSRVLLPLPHSGTKCTSAVGGTFQQSTSTEVVAQWLLPAEGRANIVGHRETVRAYQGVHTQLHTQNPLWGQRRSARTGVTSSAHLAPASIASPSPSCSGN